MLVVIRSHCFSFSVADIRPIFKEMTVWFSKVK